MNVQAGSNSRHLLEACIASVANPAVYICRAFRILCSKLQLLVRMLFHHSDLHFRNKVRRPIYSKTQLSVIDGMFRHVMNA